MQKFFTINRIATSAAVLAGLTMAALLMRPSFAAPVFPDPSSARSDIESALKQAASSHKRVLVDFGANWCGDAGRSTKICTSLKRVAALRPFRPGSRQCRRQGSRPQHRPGAALWHPVNKGVAALAVLDSDGRVVFSRRTGSSSR